MSLEVDLDSAKVRARRKPAKGFRALQFLRPRWFYTEVFGFCAEPADAPDAGLSKQQDHVLRKFMLMVLVSSWDVVLCFFARVHACVPARDILWFE